jgi:excisionase family DNA binding protein
VLDLPGAENQGAKQTMTQAQTDSAAMNEAAAHDDLDLQFFSVAEVAAILHINKRLVLDWINAGRLPVFRIGRSSRLLRIRRRDFDAFIKNNTTAMPSRDSTKEEKDS